MVVSSGVLFRSWGDAFDWRGWRVMFVTFQFGLLWEGRPPVNNFVFEHPTQTHSIFNLSQSIKVSTRLTNTIMTQMVKTVLMF